MIFARPLLAALSLSASLLFAQTVKPAPTHAAVPACKADQLSLGTDDEDGNFDGMSHSGTLLVLRNLGPDACRLDPFPHITFLDGTRVLPAQGTVPGAKFMHPGPVVMPIVLATGAEATSSLRWVSGEVYAKNNCISPNALSVDLGNGKQQTDFKGHLCGEAGQPLTYEMTRFATDPVYKGN